MKTLIDPYTIYPGEHCGSTSMRGLLEHYCGLELPEPAVFGLGAGLDCGYLENTAMDPPIVVFGRTGSFEQDLGRILDVDYREQREENDEEAWQIVREEVLAGRPTMLSGDILYLDYREYKVHFPGHRFVLLGFDDDTRKAFIADRIRDVPEACSYGALTQSRNPPEGLSTGNLWGKFHDTAVGRSLPDAARLAIRQCAQRMLGVATAPGADDGGSRATGDEAPHTEWTRSGITAIHHFAASLPGWAEREDARWIASFNARCIEKFGNGGGNFRRLYSGFLSWARALDEKLVPAHAPVLATRAADGWTTVAALLGEAAREGAAPDAWTRAASEAEQIAETELELFVCLAEAAG